MSALDVLAVLEREIAARELAPSGHAVGCIEHPPGARFPCSCNGPQLIEARAAVAELIAEAQRVADGTVGDLHYLRAALARVGGGK